MGRTAYGTGVVSGLGGLVHHPLADTIEIILILMLARALEYLSCLSLAHLFSPVGQYRV